MNFDHGEVATIERAGTPVGQGLPVGFDPIGPVIYVPADSDVAQGDTVVVRGTAYKVAGIPEVWHSPWTGWDAGIVARLQLLQFPDQATLERQTGVTWDRAGNTGGPAWSVIWQGAVLVESPSTSSVDTFAAEQRVTLMPFQVTAPLDLTDIRVDDRLTITSSQDPWLVGRQMQVTGVKGASLANLREFVVSVNQG